MVPFYFPLVLFLLLFKFRKILGQELMLSASIYEMIRLLFVSISVVEQICPCTTATGIMTVIVRDLKIGLLKKNMRLVL